MSLRMSWSGWLCGGLLGLAVVSCGGGSSSGTVPALAPVNVQVNPSDVALTASGQTSFQAKVGNASNTAVTWSVKEGAAGGSIDATGLYTAPATAGTYTIVAVSKQDPTKQASAKAVVAAKPTLATFSAAKAFLSPGGSTTLSATFSGATATVDHGVGTITSGVPVTVSPTATTTYTITVSNAAGGTITGTTTVTVETAPSIGAFSAAPAILTTGQTATLAFTFGGGLGSVDHGVGPVTSGTPVLVKPSATTTYTLTVINDAGAATTATAMVTVDAAPVAASLTAAATTISVGGSTQLTATFTGGAGSVNGTSVTSGAPFFVSPAATTTYLLTVTNPAGATATTSSTVTVVPLPSATAFTAGAATINLGGSTTLTATFAGGSGSVDHGVGAVTSGLPFTVNPAATTTYTLTVTNPAGATTTKAATVTVIPAPQVGSFTSSLSGLFKGQSATLTPVYSGGIGSIAGIGPVASGSSVSVSPAATATYTLTVTSPTGATDAASLTITVDATPFSIATFSASPAQVDFGQATTLNWTVNGTPTALTLDGASVLGSPASAPIHPVRRQAYSLGGSNPLGGDLKVLKVAARGLDLLAGNLDGFGYQDGLLASARFGNLAGAVMDATGNLYVSDYYQCVIRRITPAGVVSTFAGTLGSYGANDGTTTAQFENPNGLATDAAGNIYVADEAAATIRMITPAGVVSTLAGWAGHGGYNDATGLAAQFNRPSGLIVDPAGNVFVADTYNHVIRMITPAGVVTTIAGQANNPAYNNGVGTAALFNYPHDLALDSHGNLYVADDGNHVVRKITASDPLHGPATTWTTSLFAGTPGTQGYKDDPSAAILGTVWSILVDASDNVLITDFYYHTIRKITPAGAVTTYAGGIYIPDHADGPALAARFNQPYRLCRDLSGGLAVTEWNNTDIRHLDAAGNVTTLGGTDAQATPKDGSLASGRFNLPLGLALAPNGDLFVADRNASSVREVGADGSVNTVAGQFSAYATADGQGSAARFVWPTGLARDAGGNLYVSDSYANVIRKVSPSGFASTFVGNAAQPGGYANASGTAARFNNPEGIALDGAGNLYVADANNHVIRKVTPGGVVSLFAGIPNQYGFVNGPLGTGKLASPTGLAFDAHGDLLVADSYNNAIRSIAPDGTISTVTGGQVFGSWGFKDGDAATALFRNPTGVAVDAAGNIYVADHDNHAVRKVLPDGSSTTTVAGQPGLIGTTLGALPATLYQPWGILATPDGDLLVTTANGIVQITAP